MIIGRRAFIVAIPLSLVLAGSTQAAPKHHSHHSWNGTWSGKWGGQEPTSITIAGNKVVSYQYQGVTTPVASSNVTRTTVTYGHNGVTVTITRTGAKTATASLHSPQGDTTAELAKQ
jgi:hypothetical protein